MIIYKYSLFQDIKIALHNRRRQDFLKKEGIVYFDFNPIRTFKIIFNFYFKKNFLPEIKHIQKNITCYIVTSGTWGAYELPDKIFIFPWGIEKNRIKHTIKHEITHIEVEENGEIKNLTHKEKERVVNRRAK